MKTFRHVLLTAAWLVVPIIARADVQQYPVTTATNQWVFVSPDMPWGLYVDANCDSVSCQNNYRLYSLVDGSSTPVDELNNTPNIYGWVGWGPGGSFYYYVIVGWTEDPVYPNPIVQLRRLYNFVLGTTSVMKPAPIAMKVWGSGQSVNYTVPHDGNVTLSVYDVAGRRLATPVTGARQSAGEHRVTVDRLPPGVYFARITVDDQAGHGTLHIVH